jgi:uncharacterized protein YbjQ (UPF0145 family)
MENCVLCNVELTIGNKPLLGAGKLNDGSRICSNCYLSLSKNNKEVFHNLGKLDKSSLVNALKSKTEALERSKDILVTTGDLKQEYDILGPVYFQVSNKGIFSNTLKKLSSKYKEELTELRTMGQGSNQRSDWGFLYGEFSFGMSNDFDSAFFVSVKEIQNRAALLGADAVICMRQDIDLDTEHFQYFYLQMYGTAVKFKETINS